MALEIHPVTPARWDGLVRLAGERGFYSNCWCTWWRLSGKQFSAPPERKRALLGDLVADGREPGLLAYLDGEPVGWVALAPRQDYPRMNRSPKLKAVDDAAVWVVSCFYIDRRARRQGVGEALLAAAVDHARSHGAAAVEGVPIATAAGKKPSADLFTGTLAMFERAGFVEIARRGGRPIVRRSA